MNAPLRQPSRDLHDAADGALREQAVEALVDKLVDGKTIHRTNAQDIFECAVNDELRYLDVLALLEGLLALNCKAGDHFLLDAAALAERAKEIVQGYVLGKQDWIEEEAAEIEAARYDDE